MAEIREGPRERAARLGPQALADDELMGLVLTGGAGGKAIAARLLERFGGLVSLARAGPAELQTAAGIGLARGATLAAAFELSRRVTIAEQQPRPVLRRAREAYEFLRPRLAHLPKEVFSVTLLDVRLRVLRELTVASGSSSSCAVQPRDALAPAICEGAAAVLFAHNHPSGDPSPSAEDRALTVRLVSACNLMGVRAVDHIVVGTDGYCSLRELGAWPG